MDTLELSIDINSSRERVWDVLTKSEYISQYMFGSVVETDWAVGSNSNFYFEKDGQRMMVVNGTVTESEAPAVLEHTLFPTGASYPDVPENHLLVRYTISEIDGGSRLDILQSKFDTVEEGAKRRADSEKGWDVVLQNFKRICESA